MKSLNMSIIAQGMMGPPGDDGPLGLEGPEVRLAWTCVNIWSLFRDHICICYRPYIKCSILMKKDNITVIYSIVVASRNWWQQRCDESSLTSAGSIWSDRFGGASWNKR